MLFFNQLLLLIQSTQFGQICTLLFTFVLADCTQDHAGNELRVGLSRNFLSQHRKGVFLVFWVGSKLLKQTSGLGSNLFVFEWGRAFLCSCTVPIINGSRIGCLWLWLTVRALGGCLVFLTSASKATARTGETGRGTRRVGVPDAVFGSFSHSLEPIALNTLLSAFAGILPHPTAVGAIRGRNPLWFDSFPIPAVGLGDPSTIILWDSGFLICPADPVCLPEFHNVQDQEPDPLHRMGLSDFLHFFKIIVHMLLGLRSVKFLANRLKHLMQRLHAFKIPGVTVVCINQQNLDDNMHDSFGQQGSFEQL
mmetsp:Transcript_88761/g.147488  ORF Transcript_88761/g.147488 Transcript_88761/m.147488 type:complete len:308 (+) Transcript_88761:2971-3894(+)